MVSEIDALTRTLCVAHNSQVPLKSALSLLDQQAEMHGKIATRCPTSITADCLTDQALFLALRGKSHFAPFGGAFGKSS